MKGRLLVVDTKNQGPRTKNAIGDFLFLPAFAARTTVPLGWRSGSIRQPFSPPPRLANHEGHQGHEDTSILNLGVLRVLRGSCSFLPPQILGEPERAVGNALRGVPGPVERHRGSRPPRPWSVPRPVAFRAQRSATEGVPYRIRGWERQHVLNRPVLACPVHSSDENVLNLLFAS